jgi:hypothetical protein
MEPPPKEAGAAIVVESGWDQISSYQFDFIKIGSKQILI